MEIGRMVFGGRGFPDVRPRCSPVRRSRSWCRQKRAALGAHAWPTGTGIAGDAVTGTEPPDELARDRDFFGREMRDQFACAVTPFRMVQHIEQHVDFPAVQVSISRPAQFFAGAKESLDA